MPKIFEYFGIVFLIYTDDHEPIHVHVQHGDFESKVELIYEGGELVEVKVKKIRGKEHLPKNKLKDVVDFIKIHHLSIVERWNDIMVFHRKPKFERITKKL